MYITATCRIASLYRSQLFSQRLRSLLAFALALYTCTHGVLTGVPACVAQETNEIQILSEATAARLAKTEGPLQLNSLKTLSGEAAAALAAHTGSLYLQGLERLDSTCAAELAKHKGDLHLESVKFIDPDAAEHLVKVDGDLYLNSLFISDNVPGKATRIF